MTNYYNGNYLNKMHIYERKQFLGSIFKVNKRMNANVKLIFITDCFHVSYSSD